MKIKTIVKKRDIKLGIVAGIIILLFGLFSSTMAMANPSVNVVVYDDFNYTNINDYFNKWFSYEFIPGFNIEPQAIQTRSFGGKLHLQATPFTQSMDDVLDHVKYLAQSTKDFPIPRSGSITFSADIEAQTPGTDPNRLICPTGIDSATQPEKCKKVLEGQQAAATFHVLNIHETGQLFDWFVSEHKAFALTERLLDPLAPGIGLDKGYTQIVPGLGFGIGPGTQLATLPQQLGEYDITPGQHNYAITYLRTTSGVDEVDWLIDGVVKAKQFKIGIPLDVQNMNGNIEYPSINATGELLGSKMTTFYVGNGLFSLVDDFPFSPQYAPYFVSYPKESRIFGQGVNATFANFTVVTVTT